MKNYEGYINHLRVSRDYWKRIALAEREKNMKLEEIIKDIENRIHNLEGDKR